MTPEQRATLGSVIAIDREVMHGTPCFTGTRIPIQTLVDSLETRKNIDDFLAVHPYIPRQQVLTFFELRKDLNIEQLPCGFF